MVSLLPDASGRSQRWRIYDVAHITGAVAHAMQRSTRRSGASKNHARDQLRHSGRLIRAVQLDRVPHGQVNSGVVDLGGVDKLRSDPDPAACRNRREEPHPIESIVDAHLRVLDAVVGLAQGGNQGQRQESVGYCCTVRTFGTRAVGIDVDPLVIAGDIGERVDALLVDACPVADAQLLADELYGFVDGPNDLHGLPSQFALTCVDSYTLRAALAAADAALLRSRAAAQSSSVIAVSPANVLGPASRWPPSIAMVSPVR